jgi:hypothetical protein
MTIIIALIILAAAVYHFRDMTLQPAEQYGCVAGPTEAQVSSAGCSCGVHQSSPGTSYIAA